jgi:hypothetical protein
LGFAAVASGRCSLMKNNCSTSKSRFLIT